MQTRIAHPPATQLRINERFGRQTAQAVTKEVKPIRPSIVFPGSYLQLSGDTKQGPVHVLISLPDARSGRYKGFTWFTIPPGKIVAWTDTHTFSDQEHKDELFSR